MRLCILLCNGSDVCIIETAPNCKYVKSNDFTWLKVWLYWTACKRGWGLMWHFRLAERTDKQTDKAVRVLSCDLFRLTILNIWHFIGEWTRSNANSPGHWWNPPESLWLTETQWLPRVDRVECLPHAIKTITPFTKFLCLRPNIFRYGQFGGPLGDFHNKRWSMMK